MVPPFNLVSNVKSIIKLLSILAILVASMFSVSSCTEDWEDAYLAIDQNNFSIPSSGETKQFLFKLIQIGEWLQKMLLG